MTEETKIEEPQVNVAQESTQDQVSKTQTEETEQQINWRKFRQEREIERKQRDEARRLAEQKAAEAEALRKAMEALVNKPVVNDFNNGNDQFEDEDVRIQKKIEAAIAERDRKLELQRIERERAEYPQRLQSAYSDFNQVFSADNLDYLEYHYPEVAKAFQHMPDGFDKWASVYKACKRFIPNSGTQKNDQARIEKNSLKPQSMSVASATSTGDGAPIILDDKRRQDNWARMQRVMKGMK